MIVAIATTAAAGEGSESERSGTRIPPAIVLSTANNYRIPQPVLDAAQDIATSIYDAIGVRLVWQPAGSAPEWSWQMPSRSE
jgi:hypothetical protein